MKLAHQCFYKFSGMSMIRKELGDNKVELIEVTDKMYILSYMGTLIKNKFKIL